MTPTELAALARDSLEKPIGGAAAIALRLPGRWGKTNTRRLAGKGSPLGRIVQEDEEGITVIFDAGEVASWLEKQEAK